MGSFKTLFSASIDPCKLCNDKNQVGASIWKQKKLHFHVATWLTWDNSMYGYMSENMILCPRAYSGSTGLVSEAASEHNATRLISFEFGNTCTTLDAIASSYWSPI